MFLSVIQTQVDRNHKDILSGTEINKDNGKAINKGGINMEKMQHTTQSAIVAQATSVDFLF